MHAGAIHRNGEIDHFYNVDYSENLALEGRVRNSAKHVQEGIAVALSYCEVVGGQLRPVVCLKVY